MKLVRRARKSIRERRMKKCITDLSANLSKVEMRVFKKQKERRETKRKALGLENAVPKSVILGRMTPELYRIECRLHEEMGLPKPPPYPGYSEDVMRTRQQTQRVGFVNFATLLHTIRALNHSDSAPGSAGQLLL